MVAPAVPAHDVAIYAPFARVFYDASAPRGGGGAERQTWLLARSLARRGARVAHIVYPVIEPVIDPEAPVTLVHRPRPHRRGTPLAWSDETVEVWRALTRADPRTIVLRGAAGALGVAGLWARAHRRRLVFAGANNADFTLENFGNRHDPRAILFRAGLRTTDAVIAQSADQVALARVGFPHLRRIEEIASFVQPAPAASGGGEAFLWVSRLAEYKRPLLYADLAAAMPEARFWMIVAETEEPGFDATLAELRRRAAGLPNLEILPQRPHVDLQELIGRAVAMVNTSRFEGMPNTWLEGWSRGVPALTLSFDPDARIAGRGLGVAAGGSWDGFVAGARDLWARRDDRGGFGPAVRAYVGDVHGDQVADRWAEVLLSAGRTARRARAAR
jgi:glycosyltransferase involved in cell wall biosynthesis